MPLIQNSHGELYRSEDFAEPKRIKLGHGGGRFGQGICPECGKAFTKRAQAQGYCSDACKYAARMKREAEKARKEGK